MTYTVGSYLARRLQQIGLKHHFAVAGDFNLVLLDQLLIVKELEQVYCCNELNCGYSAEGYARACGAAAAVVTFSVGGLSAINAIGGAYAENLPVSVISGAPNTNDRATEHLVHHTLATHDWSYQLEIAKEGDLRRRLHHIRGRRAPPDRLCDPYCASRGREACLHRHCLQHCRGSLRGAGARSSAVITDVASDPETLEAAIATAATFLDGKQKPILLIGSKLRAAGAEKQAIELAEALGCAVTVMAAAKSFFPEDHPQFAGIYWGEVSSPGAREIFDWADSVVCLGTIFNDYSTVGWTAMPSGADVLTADQHRVYLEGYDFGGVHLRDFLSGLAGKVQKQPATLVEYQRIRSHPQPQQPAKPGAKLVRTEIFRQVQNLVTADTAVLAETGDSWFNGMALKLPGGARFEIEMQWGSIGWAVPATFGYAVGASSRRIIALIGDGSFQLTAQEVAQMIRRKLPVIIFLINNHGYTIEVEIHDGPYNNIKNWDYAGLIQVFNAEDGRGRGLRVTNGGELQEAIKVALANRDGPTLIECIIDRDDASPDLLSWGREVAKANDRPPRSQ